MGGVTTRQKKLCFSPHSRHRSTEQSRNNQSLRSTPLSWHHVHICNKTRGTGVLFRGSQRHSSCILLTLCHGASCSGRISLGPSQMWSPRRRHICTGYLLSQMIRQLEYIFVFIVHFLHASSFLFIVEHIFILKWGRHELT